VNHSHYQKPYKTFAEQITLIEDRGIAITDRNEAISHLNRLGYYRLSAYWYPFRRRAPDHREGIDKPDSSVVEGVVFTDIVAICDFDSSLRNALLEAISAVEVAVRVDVAYEMGKYGPLGYLDKENLGSGCNNPSALDPSVTEFDQFRQKQRDSLQNSKEAFAKHFREIYGAECPIWAAIELWDFGTLSRFYQLMKPTNRHAVAAHYGFATARKLANWLECINDLRNFCAHHSRLNRRHFPKGPAFPWSAEFQQFAHLKPLMDQARHRLYPLMCMLVYMLDRVAPGHCWRERIIGLMDAMEGINGLALSDYGVPENWCTEALWIEIV